MAWTPVWPTTSRVDALTGTRPCRASSTPSSPAGASALTPAVQIMVAAAPSSPDANTTSPAAMAGDRVVEADAHPLSLEGCSRPPPRPAGNSPSTAWVASTRTMATRSTSMFGKSWRSTSSTHSDSAPAYSTPVGPAPTADHEGEQRLPLRRHLGDRRLLEGVEHPGAECPGLPEVLEAVGAGGQDGVAEVAVGAAGGQHEVVVTQVAGGGSNPPALQVDAGHLGEPEVGVAGVAEDRPHRMGDVRRVEERRCQGLWYRRGWKRW